MAATQQIDSSVEIITPENIAFQYRVAGPFKRLPAYAVDLLIRLGLMIVGAILFEALFRNVGLAGFGQALFLVWWFVISWFYGGLFETFWNGQTPGKRMLRLRVLSVDGQPITGLQAVLRNILRAVDSLPLVPIPGLPMGSPVVPLYLVGIVVPMLNDRYARLGDLACGTMVVVEEPTKTYGVLRVDEPAVARIAATLPANMQVSRGLSRALSDYVGRRKVFSPARREEIARHLAAPLAARYQIPPGTSHDVLLCAIYHRTFIADRAEEDFRGKSSRPAKKTVRPAAVS